MIGIAVAVVLASSVTLTQESAEQRIARLKTMPAEELARAYLGNEYTLRLIDMARQGATLHLQGADSIQVVTAATADSVAAEYQRRRETYAAVIRARGFKTLTGPHVLSLKKPCDENGFFGVQPRQNEFRVTLVLRHDMGQDEMSGVVVEETLVMGDGNPDGGYLKARVRGEKIELTPVGRSGCTMVLTPGTRDRQRPSVRIDRPERLLGTWQGKWDGEFDVRFTISPSGDGYQVLYEWQEYQGGSFAADTFLAYPSSAGAIRSEFGTFEILVEGAGTPQATAVGHFGPRTRRAKLTQVRTNP